MIVVVATRDEVMGVQSRLDDLGVGAVQVVEPSADRRLLLATVDGESAAEHLAAALRAEGRIAVTRPDDGPRLEGWMRHTLPITFGDRLSVCFAWCEHDRSALPGVIELGLGGFGNGGHVTTRLLIEQLRARIRGGERVLDVGCGSGVLALSAVRLGASLVAAVDNQADAVEATRRNAALNGMDDRIGATIAALEQIEGTYDVVVANIGRAAIVELAPQLIRLLSPNGWLAISGFSPPVCSLVAEFLLPLEELERHVSGEWSALVLGRVDRRAQEPT